MTLYHYCVAIVHKTVQILSLYYFVTKINTISTYCDMHRYHYYIAYINKCIVISTYIKNMFSIITILRYRYCNNIHTLKKYQNKIFFIKIGVHTEESSIAKFFDYNNKYCDHHQMR